MGDHRRGHVVHRQHVPCAHPRQTPYARRPVLLRAQRIRRFRRLSCGLRVLAVQLLLIGGLWRAHHVHARHLHARHVHQRQQCGRDNRLVADSVAHARRGIARHQNGCTDQCRRHRVQDHPGHRVRGGPRRRIQNRRIPAWVLGAGGPRRVTRIRRAPYWRTGERLHARHPMAVHRHGRRGRGLRFGAPSA